MKVANAVDESTIANGDEVGVLVPGELRPVTEPGVDPARDDFHRTIIAALLAQVPEDEITLNAAAKRLAWALMRASTATARSMAEGANASVGPCETRSSPPVRPA